MYVYVVRMMESADAIDDSDDEVDYTKMDQGNKKGPIGRWDFDTQEEYSDYMANKEALPKWVAVALDQHFSIPFVNIDNLVILLTYISNLKGMLRSYRG